MFPNVKSPFLVGRLLEATWTTPLTLASVVRLFANAPVTQTYLQSGLSLLVESNSPAPGRILTYRPPLPIPREAMLDF